MALFNTDKSDDSRGAPKINATDVHLNRKAHATDSISPRAVGATDPGKVVTKNTQIIANDGSNGIGLFGFDSTGKMAVKVAKPGYDAATASDDELIFNSSQNVFKIVDTGILIVAAPSVSFSANSMATATTNATFSHNLGYTPAVLVFSDLGGGILRSLPFSNTGISGGLNNWTQQNVSVQITSTSLTIINEFVVSSTVSGTASGLGITVRYYLLQETAS